VERRALRRDERLRAGPRASTREACLADTLNRWIIGDSAARAREVTEAIEAYRFNEAASTLYRFIWNSSATGIWNC
jgi:valyl-tRNA synthetase